MPPSAFPAVLAALGAPVLLAGGAGQVTTMTFHERIIVRVPRLTGPQERAAPPPTAWKERAGPKCLKPGELAGALVTQPGEVDLVLAGNRRVRAKLADDCAPLDFYSGFYLKPGADGKVCAGRDAIRARSGRSCPIDAFRALKPVARPR